MPAGFAMADGEAAVRAADGIARLRPGPRGIGWQERAVGLVNLTWIVRDGLWMAVGLVIAGVIMAITIVGLPWRAVGIQHCGLYAA
jgi:hypothetical protein